MRSRGEGGVARMHGRPMVIPLVDAQPAVPVPPRSVGGAGGEAVGSFGKINGSRPGGDEGVDVNRRARTAAAPVKVNQGISSRELWSRCWHGRRRSGPCVPVFGRVAVTRRRRGGGGGGGAGGGAYLFPHPPPPL